jgi:hypothetical protein
MSELFLEFLHRLYQLDIHNLEICDAQKSWDFRAF